jgi:hypothetical protein
MRLALRLSLRAMSLNRIRATTSFPLMASLSMTARQARQVRAD